MNDRRPDGAEERQEIPAAKIHIPDDDIRTIQEEVADILRTGRLILGRRMQQFETEFAEKLGVRHAVAVSSGTAALEIILRSFGVEGKKVIVPANTFYATAAAVLHAGGKLKLVDVEHETWSLDPHLVEKNMDDETAGAIVVHIGGMVGLATQILHSMCRNRGKFFIEDAAHAHGSALNGAKAGSLSDAAAFSFFPTKVMTSVEGGMITTESEYTAREARIYRDQGKTSGAANYHTHLGSAWRLSEINAIVGLTQLRRLDYFIAHRRRIAAVYDDRLAQSNHLTPVRPPQGSASNYYKYPVMLRDGIDRDRLKDILQKEYRIRLSGEVYSTPLHMQPIFQGKFEGGPFPVADRLCARHICLPISAVMAEEDAYYVAQSLEEAINRIHP